MTRTPAEGTEDDAEFYFSCRTLTIIGLGSITAGVGTVLRSSYPAVRGESVHADVLQWAFRGRVLYGTVRFRHASLSGSGCTGQFGPGCDQSAQ